MHTRTVISLAIAGNAVLVAIGFGLYWLAQDTCLDVGGEVLAGDNCFTDALSSQPLFALVRPVDVLFVAVVAAVLVGVPVYLTCKSFFASAERACLTRRPRGDRLRRRLASNVKTFNK